MAEEEGHLADAVARALAQLPDREQAVFVAMSDGAPTFGEVAGRLGIGVDEVERAFAIALLRLAGLVDTHDAALRPCWPRRWWATIVRLSPRARRR